MALSSRPLYALCITSALAAQSPTAVLKLIPASASSVEFTWRLAESNERYLKATSPLGEKDGLVDLEANGHLTLADLAPGTVAVVRFPDPEGTPTKGKNAAAPKGDPEHPVEGWKVLMVPVKGAKELAKRLQAKPAGAVQRYTWKTDKGSQVRYLGFRDGYALVAERKALVEQALKPGPSIEADLAPLMPWMQEHDAVMVATEKSVRQSLDAFMQSADAKASPADSVLPVLFKELGQKVRASVHHVAMALDLPKDGSLRLTARAFFKAASPLALEAAAMPALAGHPLGRLPEGPYAMAMGGQWPLSMRFFDQVAGQYPGLKAEEREHMAQLLKQVNDQVLESSFCLRAPQAGEPFLQGLTGVSTLKDGKAWMAAMAKQQAWSQEHLGGAFSYQEGVLPDRPSLTVSVDLAKLAGGKLPPAQMAMVGGLLFGGNRMLISYAVVDDRTLAYTFGERDALKLLVTEVQKRKPLAATKGIQGADPLLPKDGRFLIYLDPRGVQTLVASVLKSFTGKETALAAVPETLPLVGAISVDPNGIQFSAGARPESLEAMGKVFSGLGKAMPGGDKGDKADAVGPVEEDDEMDESGEPDEDEPA